MQTLHRWSHASLFISRTEKTGRSWSYQPVISSSEFALTGEKCMLRCGEKGRGQALTTATHPGQAIGIQCAWQASAPPGEEGVSNPWHSYLISTSLIEGWW